MSLPINSGDAATAWWRTGIIDIHPGSIRVRGYAIEDLIGHIPFPAMIWLMLRGDLPTEGQARLLEAALVAAVDHGPQAPSISIARMTATCGVGLNGAIAAAVGALGDVHGGAGQQAMELFAAIAEAGGDEAATERVMSGRSGHVPGFGHRFHPVDPRAPRLLVMADEAVAAGVVPGIYAAIARHVEAWLERRKGRRIPMNIDGVTAAIYAELGFPPPLGRGLFILSRSVGILAHAWEQQRQGGRIKGPMPPSIPYTYDGPGPRELEPEA
jgi:citrate synthase